MADTEDAVRNYLTALKDPDALRDDEVITDLESRIESSEDQLERLRLRQQLLEAQAPQFERSEDAFVSNAKAWADEHGVSAEAFASEGVPQGVLRRAGFSIGRGGGKKRTKGSRGTATRSRSRVTSDEVRGAIPEGTFTIKQLQEESGASPAVVRKVVAAELEAGNISEEGADPDHQGPGRAPTLYKR
jgi:hypothetical protein